MKTISETQFYKYSDNMLIFRNRTKKYGMLASGRISEYFQIYLIAKDTHLCFLTSTYIIRKTKKLIKENNIKPRRIPFKNLSLKGTLEKYCNQQAEKNK